MKIEEQKPSNPSAFPVTATEQSYHNQSPLMPESGMTLRDYFAAKAMQSIIVGSAYDNYTGNNGMPVPDFVAKESYLMADAMLKQREI